MNVSKPVTPFMQSVEEVLRRVDANIAPGFLGTVDAYLVGGVAVHVYTGWRVSKDVDVAFSHRLVLAPVTVAYVEDGAKKAVRLDTNFTDALGLFHCDWMKTLPSLAISAG